MSMEYEPFDYVSYDTSMTKDYYDRYCLGSWNTEEEKEEGNKMKLIEIYKEKSLENVNDYYDKKIKEHRESDQIYNGYQEVIKEANEKLKRLYVRQNYWDDLLYELEENCDFSDNIKYELCYRGDDGYTNQIKDERKKVINSINEKIKEAEAHIELINQFTDKNYEYTDVIDILTEYGITDEKGHITPYEIKEENPKPAAKKRGRKPSKKSE